MVVSHDLGPRSFEVITKIKLRENSQYSNFYVKCQLQRSYSYREDWIRVSAHVNCIALLNSLELNGFTLTRYLIHYLMMSK